MNITTATRIAAIIAATIAISIGAATTAGAAPVEHSPSEHWCPDGFGVIEKSIDPDTKPVLTEGHVLIIKAATEHVLADEWDGRHDVSHYDVCAPEATTTTAEVPSTTVPEATTTSAPESPSTTVPEATTTTVAATPTTAPEVPATSTTAVETPTTATDLDIVTAVHDNSLDVAIVDTLDEQLAYTGLGTVTMWLAVAGAGMLGLGLALRVSTRGR